MNSLRFTSTCLHLKRSSQALLAFVLLLSLAFTSSPAQAQIRTIEQGLLGDVEQEECTDEQQEFNNEIFRYGRIAAVSDAYEDCIRQEVAARYKECNGDPFYGQSQRRQIERVRSVSLSRNDLRISCTGGSGNASAAIGTYGHTTKEEFSWGGWFGAVHSSLDLPVCSSGQNPDDDNCRYAAYPWPYTQAAGIVWHEVMHTHGYTHGANAQDPAKVACGYPNATDRVWHFQRNTMPYIVGQCIGRVLERSGSHCNLQSCSGDNQLEIVTSYNSSSCKCVRDPGRKGIGILGLKDGTLVDEGIHPTGQRIGGWMYASDNEIAGIGDFNGDGRTDFILTSNWGIGIATFDGSRWQRLMAKPNGTRFGGWNYQSKDNTVEGIGDFNGDGRDDIVIRSDWGIGILTMSGSDLRTLMIKPRDTWFGKWRWDASVNRGRDTVEGVADFTGNGRADLLVSSNWGMGVLTLSGSSLTSVVAKKNGTRFGGWNYQSKDNTIEGTGDFNNDGRDDIVIRSDWGIGILTMSGSDLRTLMIKPRDTWFGEWRWDASVNRGRDTVEGVADFTGNGRADLLVSSRWGIGVLTLSGSSLTSVVAKKNGTRFGGWNYQSKSNDIVAVGPVDTDQKADIVIRSNWGMGVLEVSSSTLRSLDMTSHGKLFGSWLSEEKDRVISVAQFAPGSSGEILIQSPK